VHVVPAGAAEEGVVAPVGGDGVGAAEAVELVVEGAGARQGVGDAGAVHVVRSEEVERRRGGCAEHPVGDGVGERHRAVVVLGRDEGPAAVGVGQQLAGRGGQALHRERRAGVLIGGVGQQLRHGDDPQQVLARGDEGRRAHNGSLVEVRDVDRDLLRVGR
jgi:hypothetical protein